MFQRIFGFGERKTEERDESNPALGADFRDFVMRGPVQGFSTARTSAVTISCRVTKPRRSALSRANGIISQSLSGAAGVPARFFISTFVSPNENPRGDARRS
jgi:hypothetical protein